MAIIYVATCTLNNMVYLGQTNRSLQERLKEHQDAARQGDSTRFHQELLSQGFANWKWDVLAHCDESDAYYEDEKWIGKFRAKGLDLLNYTHNPKESLSKKKTSRFKRQASANKAWESADAIAWMYMDGKIMPVKNLTTGVIFRSLSQASIQEKIGRASIKRSCETGYLAMNNCKYAYIDLEGNEQLTDGHKKQLWTKVKRSYSAIKHLGTGKTFHTVEEVAEAFGLRARNVQAVCGNQYKSTNGHSFCYIDHDGREILLSKHKQFLEEMAKKERYCLAAYELEDTNYEHPHLFSTSTEMAETLGIKNRGHIPAVVKGKRSHIEGFRVARYDKNLKQPILTERHKLPPKKVIKTVICLDDDKIFQSPADAAREYGVNAGQIRQCCKGNLMTTGRGKKRLRFAYADENGNSILTATHNKAEESLAWKGIEVYCPEFEKRFRSVADFCREARAKGANIPAKRVRRHLDDPTVSLGGLHVYKCND